MFFDINGSEFLIILVIILLVIGPERLPQYVQQFTKFIRGAKQFVDQAKSKVDEELGPEVSSIDWQKLDPRQYDPRKIVRDTLIEDTILDPNYQAKQALKAQAAASAGTSQATMAVAAASGASTLAANAAQPLPPTVERALGFESYRPLAVGIQAPFDSEAT